MRIGWIGLGRIGLPMMTRMVSSEHRVIAWDRTPAAMEAAVAAGAVSASDVADVAVADLVILCLPSAEAVEAVVFGPGGIAASPAPGCIVADHSTVSPARTREFARRAWEASGRLWVDMPISGGIEAARNGQLIGWAGGEPESVNIVTGVASAYCAHIHPVGPCGNGQLIKACNQMIVGSTVAAWSQMLRLCRAAGVDPKLLVPMLQGGGADSRVGRSFGGHLAAGTFPAQSRANFTKDLLIVESIADDLGIDLPLAAASLAELLTIAPGSA